MNPGKTAIEATSCRIDSVELGLRGHDETFEADSLVDFVRANLGSLVVQTPDFSVPHLSSMGCSHRASRPTRF